MLKLPTHAGVRILDNTVLAGDARDEERCHARLRPALVGTFPARASRPSCSRLLTVCPVAWAGQDAAGSGGAPQRSSGVSPTHHSRPAHGPAQASPAASPRPARASSSRRRLERLITTGGHRFLFRRPARSQRDWEWIRCVGMKNLTGTLHPHPDGSTGRGRETHVLLAATTLSAVTPCCGGRRASRPRARRRRR